MDSRSVIISNSLHLLKHLLPVWQEGFLRDSSLVTINLNTPMLRIRKLRYRELTCQNHTAKRQSWDSNISCHCRARGALVGGENEDLKPVGLDSDSWATVSSFWQEGGLCRRHPFVLTLTLNQAPQRSTCLQPKHTFQIFWSHDTLPNLLVLSIDQRNRNEE